MKFEFLGFWVKKFKSGGGGGIWNMLGERSILMKCSILYGCLHDSI